jgi:hypothetical protein
MEEHFLPDVSADSARFLTQERWYRGLWEEMDFAANQKLILKKTNQTKTTMKKSNIQKRKLTKSELKEINGGNGPIACPEGLCKIGDDQYVIGPVGRDGYCC